MAEQLSHRIFLYHICVPLMFVAGLALLPTATAQQVELPAGSDADHKRLQQIRAEAQLAQQDAQIAALRRTATQSTEQSNRDRVLQQSRLDKEFKRRAALAVQQQQAINAYEKVKQAQIDSWNGKGKKISSGVPADFTANLPPLEEDTKKKRGLLSGVARAPGNAIKGLAALRPGFMSRKKKGPEPIAQFAPPESLRLDAVTPPIPEPKPAASTPIENETFEEPEKRGFRIPLISKLTGGKNNNENPYIEEDDSTIPPAPMQAADPLASDFPPEEKKGFFKGFASRNKKNSESESDAYYGPDSADIMDEEPTSGFLSKLSLKKKGSNDDGVKEGNSSTRKNIFIVDSQKAQFFPFGNSGQQANAQALGEGTIVRMTKSGDDWSSIELSSGSMGVMRNKYLRKAKGGEVPTNMFAHKPKVPYPTTARISKARSATGKGAAHRYKEPVNVPLPDLPSGGTDMDIPIGNGLLPPLKESSIQ